MTHPSKKKSGLPQFRISTILSWTGVVAFLLVAFRIDKVVSELDMSSATTVETFSGSIEMLIVFSIFILPPFLCIPNLIDRLLHPKHSLIFSTSWRLWTTAAIAIYSVAMLMLASIGFSPEWKGSKGLHWFYYTLDDWAGLTLWPIYILGAGLFVVGLYNDDKAKRSPLILIGVLANAAISFWYAGASIFFNFLASSQNHPLSVVPAACGVCYSLYAAIMIRNRKWTFATLQETWAHITGWFVLLFVSIGIKYPLALRFYESLPDEQPEGCFVVTAASRGHQRFVGSWLDDQQQRIINRQLQTFWKFEANLKLRFPQPHRRLRLVYNRVGPMISKCIRFRWQADLMYVILKPLEWIARFLTRSIH